MSQHDFNIANQTASATRADLNNALGALASLSSGTTAPTTTFANMLWYETDTNWLWVRNEADSAWIRFAYFNQSTNQLALEDNTYVVDTAGNQTGLLGDQATGTWQAGTGTTQSLVSPANIKAAVLSAQTDGFSNSTEYNLGLLSATTGTAAHGIGAYPKLVSFVIQCVTADAGYAVGDRLSFVQAEAANTNFNGITGWYSSSTVGFAHNDAPLIITKTGGNANVIASRWRVYARVWG